MSLEKKNINLEDARKNIDRYDDRIIDLLEKRLDCVVNIAKYKLENSMNIFDAEREKLILQKVGELTQNKEYAPYIKDTYTGIMDASKNFQKKLISAAAPAEKIYIPIKNGEKPELVKVAYQGVPGSYSEEAMRCYFKCEIDAANCKSFEQVADRVTSGEADYGILPIENSSTGAVVATVDLLAKYDLYITGEYVLPVRHNLVAKKGAELSGIKEVYSHEQGFLQCADFLKKYPDWEQIEYMNTAVSAKMVAESDGFEKAAIAGKRAAEIYGLDILAEGINGESQNSTRFVIFSKIPENKPSANKISVMFSLPHRSGTLFEAMRFISERGLNLLKIESRPLHRANWEYAFFIDFEGNIREERCADAIKDLKNMTGTFRLLGNYEKDGKEI